MIQIITPALEGCVAATVVHDFFNQIKIIQKGGDAVLSTPILQSALIGQSLSMASKTLEAYKFLPLSKGYYFSCAIPLLLFLLNRSGLVLKKPSPEISCIQNHLHNVAVLTTLVSSVALFAIGQTSYALSYASILGLSAICDAQLLSSNVGKTFFSSRRVLSVIAGFFTTATGARVGAGFVLLDYLTDLHFGYGHSTFTPPPKPLSEIPFSKEAFQKLRNKTPQVNRNYIHSPIIHHPQQNDAAIFRQKLDNMTEKGWADHLPVLRKKLKDPINAEKYNAEHLTDVSESSDQDLQDLVKGNLTTLINHIRSRTFPDEQPDYEDLNKNLDILATVFPTLSNISQIDMLFFLAIDAGTFCAPKVAGLIAEQAKRYVIEDPSLSLENTILVALQQKRKRIFDGMYERDLRPILRFCWMENQHSYNTASNLLEEPFGLNNLSAQNDGASRTSFLDRLFFYYISGFRAERTLWEQHEYTDICDLMSELHENNQLPRDKTTTFLKKWIEAQPIEQSIKATYLADLDNGHLFGQKIMLNGFVKPNFVKFILYGMGIINLPT